MNCKCNSFAQKAQCARCSELQTHSLRLVKRQTADFVAKQIEDVVAMVKANRKESVVIFVSDNGGEFCGEETQNVFGKIKDRCSVKDFSMKIFVDANHVEKGLPHGKKKSRGGIVVKIVGGPIYCR